MEGGGGVSTQKGEKRKDVNVAENDGYRERKKERENYRFGHKHA